jgi:hypothetical protein
MTAFLIFWGWLTLSSGLAYHTDVQKNEDPPGIRAIFVPPNFRKPYFGEPLPMPLAGRFHITIVVGEKPHQGRS